MDQHELELVRGSMRKLLDSSTPAQLPAELIASGWVELLDDDPFAVVSMLADEQGRSLTAAPTLDLVVLHAAGLVVDADTALVLPPVRRGPPTSGRLADGRLVVDGLVLAGHARASTFVVLTADDLVTVPVSALELDPVVGSDPDLGLHRASGEVHATMVTPVGSVEARTAALTAGRRFLAAELVGLADRMLDDTVAYVLERHQFGRPIASFQTVKHRLADVRVAITAARAGLATAWTDGTYVSAMAAKSLAGRAHRLASASCHQVHGGIAFTVEHGFHRFIRRGQVLDGLLGSADDLVGELGRLLLVTERVPRTPQLREASRPAW